MIKYLITDYKVINLYGDMLLYDKNTTIMPFIGKRLMVKILGLWWVKRKEYKVKPNYF